jgi:hypothetical protein
MSSENKIILFSKVEPLCNIVLNGIILSFNIIFFVLGAYFIIVNAENLNKANGIQDCGNVFLSIGCITLNSLIIIIFISRTLFSTIFAFCSTLLLSIFSIYNLNKLNNKDETCLDYYNTNYNNLWLYYNFGSGLLFFNLVIFILKYISYINTNLRPNKPFDNKDIQDDIESNEKLINTKNEILLNTTTTTNPNTNNSIYANVYEDLLEIEEAHAADREPIFGHLPVPAKRNTR